MYTWSMEIKEGQTLKRIVDGRAVGKDHIYRVVKYNFSTGGVGDDLVADGGFIKELITKDRVSEYVVVDDLDQGKSN
jgi:hypothetical protein